MSTDPPVDAGVGVATTSSLAPPQLTDSSPSTAVAPASTSITSPADVRAQIEKEQAFSDLEDLVRAREEELHKLKVDKDAVESQRDAAVSITNQLRTQLATLQSTHLQSSSELSVIQSRIEAAEREKRELLEEIQRLQEKANRATQDVYTLRSQKSEASQKIAHLDVEVSELKMNADSSKFNEERSVQALQNARTEILNLTKAATDAEARFGMYRAQTQTDLSQLQLENETVQSRITSVQSSYNSLQRTFEEQSRRLAEAHANIATLTAGAASYKTKYRLEFDRLQQECRLVEKRGDEARLAVAEREAELERLSENISEKERLWDDRLKREERARREVEKRADDLKLVVERLALASGEGSGNDISPAATLAAKQREGGKSYTQFFTDYTIQEGKLRAAENEVARLTTLLEEISQDIAEKKPLLDEQAAEHDHAIERANALAGELASAISARDNYEARVKALEAGSAHHADDVSALQSTADDLSRQVQVLLREIAIRDDPSLASASIDMGSSATVAIETGDIVTDRLLEFNSLRSLQEQNQRLLKLTRGLVAKLDAREISRATSTADDIDTGAALDQATEAITRLHTQLLDAQKRINETTRERDFFSKLLARGEGLRWSGTSNMGNGNGGTGAGQSKGPLEDGGDDVRNEQAVIDLQNALDNVRRKAELDIAEAQNIAREKSEAAGVAEVERVKAEAKMNLLEEQHRILNEARELQKNEYSGLESQVRHLQSQITQAQMDRRLALEQVATHQAAENRLRDDAAFLRAEREQWQSTQSRLQTDFSTVQQERARLQHIIDNLSNVNAEIERTRSEERARLEQRIEDLQREATNLRAQADAAREATRVAERKVAETDARIASETAAIRAEKESAEALVSTKTTEIESLTQQLGDAKRIGLNWQRRSKELTENAAGHTAAIAAKEAEVAALKTELEEVSAKVADVEKKATDAERASQLKDGTIQRLQAEQAKSAQSGHANTADSGQLAAMTAERDSVLAKLAQAEKDLEAAKATAAAAEAKAAASATATAVVADASAATPSGEGVAEIQAKLDAVTKKLAERDELYDRNVTKVNRANIGLQNRAKALTEEKTALDAKIAELEKEVAELKVKLDAASAASAGAGTGEGASQIAIDEAVKTAVAKREAELGLQHAAELASASAPDATAAATREAGLEAQISELQTKLDAAAASGGSAVDVEEAVKAATAAVTAESDKKIKTLERQVRTAEISRKTLERQKADLETKLRTLEAGASAPTTPAPATPSAASPALSAAAPPFKPVPPKGLPAKPSLATPTTAALPLTPAPTPASPVVPASTSVLPTTTAPAAVAAVTATPPAEATATTAVRGAARGRARGAIRGRGAAPGRGAANSILSAVNATLASESGTKRPAPDDEPSPPAAAAAATVAPASSAPGGGDILARLQSNANTNANETPAAGTTPTRAVKRLRGAAAGARGRGTGRRPSGGGAAGAE